MKMYPAGFSALIIVVGFLILPGASFAHGNATELVPTGEKAEEKAHAGPEGDVAPELSLREIGGTYSLNDSSKRGYWAAVGITGLAAVLFTIAWVKI